MTSFKDGADGQLLEADISSLTLGDPARDIGGQDRPEAQPGFVTGVRLKRGETLRTKDGKRATDKKKLLLIEQVPEAGPKVIEARDENYQLANDFGSKVDALLEDHAGDFYLCFRVHMFNVLKLLREVKEKADRQEARILNDPTIEYLEKRLGWFMTEALRLDKVCKDLKGQVDEAYNKVDSLAQDCQDLSHALKSGQRRNKVIWAAAERARLGEKNAISHVSMSKSRSAAALPALGSSAAAAASAQTALTKRITNGSGSLGRSPSVGALPPLSDSLSTIQGLKQQMEQASTRAAARSEREQWYTNTIKDMRLQLEQIQKEAATLRQARGASLGYRSQLEEFFLRSISEARRDQPRRIRERKGREPDNSEQIYDMLIGSEQVLITLYEGLFPHRAGIGHRFLALKSEATPAPPVGELYMSQQMPTGSSWFSGGSESKHHIAGESNNSQQVPCSSP